jgi:hypothetical protein
MGGTVESEAFQVFAELSCRAFMLARDNAEALHALVAGMADSALPCFHFADTLPRLWARFRPEEGDLRACAFWRAEILASARSVSRCRSVASPHSEPKASPAASSWIARCVGGEPPAFVERAPCEADHRLNHHRHNSSLHARKQRSHHRHLPKLGIKRGKEQNHQGPRQHEQQPRDQPAACAFQPPACPCCQLHRLRAGQQHAQ